MPAPALAPSPALALVLALALALATAGCSGATGGAYLSTSGSGASGSVQGSTSPGEMRLNPSICNGIPELRPDYKPLDEGALMSFLKTHGFETTRTRARSDLVYVDITNAGPSPVRLRVAILATPPDAGRDLHEALLQHGPGSWGVHRSNLAILAPIGSDDEIIALAVKTKLACWGVLTLTGRDDTFVVPGGYTEL